MELRISPEPERPDAIEAAVRALLAGEETPAAYRSAWRERGIRENVDPAYGDAGRPRSNPGATRA